MRAILEFPVYTSGFEESIDRREITRSLACLRMDLEREFTMNVWSRVEVPAGDLLYRVARAIGLSPLEVCEALGADYIIEECWTKLIPCDLPTEQFERWCGKHEGKSLGALLLD